MHNYKFSSKETGQHLMVYYPWISSNGEKVLWEAFTGLEIMAWNEQKVKVL